MLDNSTVEILAKNNPFIFEEINDNNIGTDFDKESASTGDIVCITSLYDELIRRFGSYKNAKFIYNFARSAIVDCKYAQNYPITAVPYLDFTVYLEQTIIDEGILTPYVKKWVAGKKYYVGDVVYYSVDGSDENIKTYILTSGDYTEKTEIPFSIYKPNAGKNNYVTENSKYYVISSYYRGYYDEKTRLTYFDSLNSDGTLRLDHWEEHITTNINENRHYSGITGTTESLLQDVMRKKTDMDIFGNTLPFILHYNDVYNGQIRIRRELDTGTTETFYMCGNMNMNYDFESGKVVSDVLESVTFYNSNSVPESGVSFTDVNVPIIITSDKNAYTNIQSEYFIGNFNMVQFVYYSSATLVKEGNDWVRKDNTGVKYVERRPMIIQTEDFDIEINDGTGTILSLTYIDINPNTQTESDDDNIDIINSFRSDVNYSNVTVDRGQLGDDYFLNAVNFKDETIMGVQNVTEEINVDIERGIAESFQKHNMLGEICTLQDLENYKNGKYLE